MRLSCLLVAICVLTGCVRDHDPTDQAKAQTDADPRRESTLDADQPASNPVSIDEVDEAFAWFDTLGFPRMSDLQFVKIATAGWTKHGEADYEKHFTYGFLLGARDEHFRAFKLTSLTEATYAESTENTPAHEKVYFTSESFEDFARGRLIWHRDLSTSEEFSLRYEDIVPLRAQFFVIARVCAESGLRELGRELAVYASQMAVHEQGDDQLTLRDIMEREIGYATAYADTLACWDEDIPRSTLLSRFERFVRLFTNSKYLDAAKEKLEVLRLMVREDEEHSAEARSPTQPVDPKDHIAGLIFQLRDQGGGQLTSGSTPHYWLTQDGNPTPAAQLESLGYDAVPQLLEVLDDRRLTRIRVHSRHGFSPWIPRVGDCARFILGNIAGRDFWQPDQAREWWAELQQNGEEAVWVEAVAAGGYDAPDQARRLVEKFPSAALAAIRAGVMNTEHRSVRGQLILAAGGLDDPAAIEFLREQLNGGIDNDAVAAAAAGLFDTEPDKTLAVVIQRWRESTGDHFDVDELVEFLVRTRRVAAIEALEAGLTEN